MLDAKERNNESKEETTKSLIKIIRFLSVEEKEEGNLTIPNLVSDFYQRQHKTLNLARYVFDSDILSYFPRMTV